jgi:hypothetical protein
MDINFKTGLLKVTDDSISLQWNGNNVSMYRWQIGKVDVVTSKELNHQPFIYGFRLGGISIGFVILTFIFKSHLFEWVSLISVILAIIIVFGDLILGLFGINIIHNILLNFLGQNSTKVRIQNTSGQDIEFYILPSEKTKARSIVDLRIEKYIDEKPKTDDTTNHDAISQIEKLYSLKEKGIITEEEFEKKKSKLLDI